MFPYLEAEQSRKKMTDQEVADYLSVSRQTYWKKKHTGKFLLDEAQLLCKLFEKDVKYLFTTYDEISEKEVG